MATIISKNSSNAPLNEFSDDYSEKYSFTLEANIDEESIVIFNIEVSKKIYDKYKEHDTIQL